MPMVIADNEGKFCPFLGEQVKIVTADGSAIGTICTSSSEIADGVNKIRTGDNKPIRICPYAAGAILSKVSPEGCREMHLSADPR